MRKCLQEQVRKNGIQKFPFKIQNLYSALPLIGNAARTKF